MVKCFFTVKVRNFVFIAVRCFPSSAWETTLQALLAVTGSGASGTAFPSRAWEGADDKIPLTFICRGDG